MGRFATFWAVGSINGMLPDLQRPLRSTPRSALVERAAPARIRPAAASTASGRSKRIGSRSPARENWPRADQEGCRRPDTRNRPGRTPSEETCPSGRRIFPGPSDEPREARSCPDSDIEQRPWNLGCRTPSSVKNGLPEHRPASAPSRLPTPSKAAGDASDRRDQSSFHYID